MGITVANGPLSDSLHVHDDGRHDSHGHGVQFYDSDSYLFHEISPFIGNALHGGDSAVVIATEAHRHGLAGLLNDSAIDFELATRQGRYIALDAAQTLGQFMVDGQPDPVRFFATVGSVIKDATTASGLDGRVVAFGEMVALLYADGQVDAALRLEQLWNELAHTYDFSLRCAYPMQLFTRESDGTSMTAICIEHDSVVPTEAYTSLDSAGKQSAIVLLQQKAQVLEREIAERKRFELALSERNRELAEALALRDVFLSVAAHELKTPLTGMRLSVQLVQRMMQTETASSAQIDLFLSRLDAQTGKLTRLVEQLLDISRLQQGQLALEPVVTDVRSVVESVLNSVCAAAPDREIQFSAPESLTAAVDALRLEQVITNLLDNALKYSPDGGLIEIDLLPEGEDLRLTVRDRGIGVAPEAGDRIFEPFYRVPVINQPPGVGLGLHITRQIVELHGGQIRAELPEDGGTRFVVNIPIRRAVA